MEWHRVIVWGRQGTNCSEMLAKGRQLYAEGRLRTRSYDKDGQKHYATEIIAQRVQFLGPKPNGGVAEAPANEEIPANQDIPF